MRSFLNSFFFSFLNKQPINQSPMATKRKLVTKADYRAEALRRRALFESGTYSRAEISFIFTPIGPFCPVKTSLHSICQTPSAPASLNPASVSSVHAHAQTEPTLSNESTQNPILQHSDDDRSWIRAILETRKPVVDGNFVTVVHDDPVSFFINLSKTILPAKRTDDEEKQLVPFVGLNEPTSFRFGRPEPTSWRPEPSLRCTVCGLPNAPHSICESRLVVPYERIVSSCTRCYKKIDLFESKLVSTEIIFDDPELKTYRHKVCSRAIADFTGIRPCALCLGDISMRVGYDCEDAEFREENGVKILVHRTCFPVLDDERGALESCIECGREFDQVYIRDYDAWKLDKCIRIEAGLVHAGECAERVRAKRSPVSLGDISNLLKIISFS